MNYSDLLKEVEAQHPYVVELRRFFHQHPELSREEYGTAERIEAELAAMGLQPRRVGETGVYAEITGQAQAKAGARPRTLVLRADIDALPIEEMHESAYKSLVPGKMHACGHDAHTASLLGAARILAAHKADFPGTVRLVFQQAEEIGYGARVFVNEGLLEGADRTFGLHTAPDVPAGRIAITAGANNASVDWFKITVQGKAAHVATPHLGADAVYIASQIVVALQALITRCTSPMENALVGIGKVTAGDAYNIVAQKAELEGTVRVLSPAVRAALKSQIEKLAANTADTYGGRASIEWKDFTSPLINDATATAEAQATARRLFGSEAVITDRTPVLTGDDFAELILAVPGAYAYLGTADKARPETCVPWHNATFDIDEKSLRTAVAMYAGYALDFLG